MVGRLLSFQMVTFQFRSIKLQGMHGWRQTIDKSPESLATKQRWDHWPTCGWSCLQVDKILLKLFLLSLSKFATKKRIALLMVPTHQNIGQMRNLPQRVTIDAVKSRKAPLITIHFSKLSGDRCSVCQGTTMARAAFCSAAFLLGHAALTTIFFSW